jgi:hypothetical protein
MMGRQDRDQRQLFYEFCLDEMRTPATLAALTSRPRTYDSAPVHPPSSKG